MTGNAADQSTLKIKTDLLMIYAVEDNVSIRISNDKPITLSQQHLFISSAPVEALIEFTGGAYISILVSYQHAEK